MKGVYFNTLNEIRHEKLISTCNQYMYHYTSAEGFRGILGGGKDNDSPVLYFTQYDSLNDIKERQDVLDALNAYCDEACKTMNMSRKLSDALTQIELNDVFDFFNETSENCFEHNQSKAYTYICSFSKEKDSLPMWRMYSKNDNYNGYSIGFFTSLMKDEFPRAKGYRIDIDDVIYDDDVKQEIIEGLVGPIIRNYDGLDQKEIYSLVDYVKRQILKYQFVFKNQSFAYEKEIRAILQVPIDKKQDYISERKFRTSRKGILIPYVEVTIPQTTVCDFTLGPSLKDKVSKRNAMDFLKSKGYDGMRCEVSNIPIRTEW